MIIFVGDKPSLRMKPGAKPFEGAACEKRLKKWIKRLGITDYEIVNAYDDTCVKSEVFRTIHPYSISFSCAALRRLEAIKKGPPYIRFIALGNIAAAACKDINAWYFKLPHPSARNRQLNDKAFIDKKLKECREWLKK